MIQLTILKINGYGPWTLTLGSDREHELQILQASLYEEIQRLFSRKDCLAFLNRADEFFVITNGLGLNEHLEIQKNLENSFDIRLSMSIGFGSTPYEANLKAYEGKKNQIFLNRDHNIYGFVNNDLKDTTIMHLDVENLTSQRQNFSPYDISSKIIELYSKMSKFFLEKRSLTFFMGGDNFMVVASNEAKTSVQDFIDLIKKEDQITLNCGIGTAIKAREAVKLATQSLDKIREIRDSGNVKPEVYELSC